MTMLTAIRKNTDIVALGAVFAVAAATVLGMAVRPESHIRAAWQSAEPLRQLTLLRNNANDAPYLVVVQKDDGAGLDTVLAKAGQLPDAKDRIPGRAFDITYSETLLEHLGIAPRAATSKVVTSFKPL